MKNLNSTTVAKLQDSQRAKTLKLRINDQNLITMKNETLKYITANSARNTLTLCIND